MEAHKICVLIPTYNNAKTLSDVINSVLAYSDHVVVVNDGSTDDTDKILAHFPTIQVVRYADNKGKGWALRQGFQYAVSKGYDYAITIDSDGQHFASDIPLFLEKRATHPNDIIIGARNMDQQSVPGKSSFGHRFSNFWFWVETGYKASDTQSGYRLYPLFLLKDLTFYTVKYEFEIEVIVRGSWHGVGVSFVPVQVYYPPQGERITHFRPFKDFTRVSVLNTILVLIAFLYIKPRDFFIGIFKKKSSGKPSESTFSTPRNLT